MSAKLMSAAAGLGLAAGMLAGIGSPAAASGTQNLNPAKVCFVNASGQALYFRAFRDGKVTRGTKLGKSGTFCAAQPAPDSVRISHEKDGKVLCNRKISAGRAYTLTGLSKDGKCRWTRKAA